MSLLQSRSQSCTDLWCHRGGTATVPLWTGPWLRQELSGSSSSCRLTLLPHYFPWATEPTQRHRLREAEPAQILTANIIYPWLLLGSRCRSLWERVNMPPLSKQWSPTAAGTNKLNRKTPLARHGEKWATIYVIFGTSGLKIFCSDWHKLSTKGKCTPLPSVIQVQKEHWEKVVPKNAK